MLIKNKLIFIIPIVLIFCLAPSLMAQTKIMCLGDSITGNPGCWRALLWRDLVDNGYTEIDFVGSNPGDGCGFAYDSENEGHGGIKAVDIAEGNKLPPWLSAANPDIVLMFLGTNDTWSGKPTSSIIDAFTVMVEQMRVNNPDMIILVAQITPNNPSDCSTCNPNVIALNAAIPRWAAEHTSARSPIIVVDQYTGYNTDTDTGDGCHPNDSGIVKIAAKWYTPLTEVLDGVMPTPGPTPEPDYKDCAGVPQWSPDEAYFGSGTQVVYKGYLYETKWYSLGHNPEENSGQYDVWTLVGLCDPGQTPGPTPENTPEVTEEPGIVGDANDDGAIDIVDALLVAQYYVQLISEINLVNADANCDAAIDIVDALLIAQYYVGLITELCL